eukprot:5785911-Amphidinium_carterae.1
MSTSITCNLGLDFYEVLVEASQVQLYSNVATSVDMSILSLLAQSESSVCAAAYLQGLAGLWTQ